ncbi:MAG: asparagine synthase (glutamine-hydrolyzing) [Flammeovirgaceae bacterium]|nr:asparagine synthase (glutamine-hydrolyzing) [Flammeovirgaceae bacterium]
MCGITGVFAFNLVGKFNMIHVTSATMALQKRGPDFQDIYLDEFVALGHRRLSIIDTRAVAHQPMRDITKRYTIVFNGEIFNYQEIKLELEARGIAFNTESDTEVLLNLFILEKENCLNRLNGFFSFCIYDKQEQTFFLARDRYGIKPLLYLFDEDKFLFGSEMKALVEYGIDKEIDFQSLYTYLQLNYIPAPATIFTHVKKLMPGHYLKISYKKLETHCYYTIPERENQKPPSDYTAAKNTLTELLEDSVKRRLISDVPIGSFLSGGIDSSVITTLAAKYKPDLHTFSIGFKDEKFFDETHYAQRVADHLKTNHTVFSLTNDDLLAHVHQTLDYLDEPFADSSALNVFILSKETRKHATVALSGDGADELLGGYNKHAAFHRIINKGWQENLTGVLEPLWKSLPQSRNSRWSNRFRQLSRFAEGMKLTSHDRYWQWAGFAKEAQALDLLSDQSKEKFQQADYIKRKQDLLKTIPVHESMREILLTDVNLVLPNDMLTKVDLMSMAHGLEVRVPFLDYRLVDFIFSLPDDYKITRSIRKRILQDAFRDVLPKELYNRPKKGFEVPLLKWFRKELKSWIIEDLLTEKYIHEQGIFAYPEIKKLLDQLFSTNPQDAPARIWGLIVFQWWWRKFMK